MTTLTKKRTTSIGTLIFGILLSLGFITNCAVANPIAKAQVVSPNVSFSPITRGLVEPTSVATNYSSNIYVTQRSGQVRLWKAHGGLVSTPWLDVSKLITAAGGEQGLLGLTFHPNFIMNGLAYITYTRPGGALVVAKVNTYRGWPTKVTPIIIVPHPGAQNHNGGSLAWHPDGNLLVGTGDGGGGGDTFDNARWSNKPLGKILKVNVNAVKPTATVWLKGLRNPWKMSVDTVTSQLWIADVGQDKYEEIDRIALPTPRADLGWPCQEGFASYDSARCAGRTMVKPIATFCHPDNVSGCLATDRGAEAIIGGYIYRGKTYANKLGGYYITSDFVTGNVWTISPTGSIHKAGTLNNPTGFGQTNTKEIVVATYDGTLWILKAN